LARYYLVKNGWLRVSNPKVLGLTGIRIDGAS
jgi:hypothetical protein